jgi:intracellular septation protein
MPRRLPHQCKLLLDFAPLGVFFAAYKLADIMTATVALVIATALSLAIIYAVERKIALAPLISGVLVAVMGGLTVLLDNELFIKVKPTLLNLAFSAVLLSGVYLFKKGLLKYVLEMAVSLTHEGWLRLSKRWGFFFLFLAGLNELIWRSFPTEFWVNFKVFGMFTLTIAFALSQWKLIERYSVAKSD